MATQDKFDIELEANRVILCWFLINATDAHFDANPILGSSGQKPAIDERRAARTLVKSVISQFTADESKCVISLISLIFHDHPKRPNKMTVSYMHKVGTVSQFTSFTTSVLFRWRGGLFQAIYPHIFYYILAYVTLALIYTCILQQHDGLTQYRW